MKMEKENGATSLKALEYFYYHRVLTEYLTTLSDEELQTARTTIELDDIEGNKIGILDAIIQEMEYRADNKIYEERESSRAK